MAKKKALAFIGAALALLIAVGGYSVYAWFYIAGDAGTMTFRIAKVNSEMYFYTAKDSNQNGVVDLLTSGDSPVAVDSAYQKPEYYKETRYFDFVARAEAKAETSAEVTIETITISDYVKNILPSQIYTIKISLVNKGDTQNQVAIRLTEKSDLTEAEQKLYSAFALRVVKVVNDSNLQSDEPTYEKHDWVYLCDNVEGTTFKQLSVIEDTVPGLDEQTEADKTGDGEVVNVADYWLQFQLLPYEDYLLNVEQRSITQTILSKEDYQSLQGAEFSFDLSMLFEVNV